MCSKTKGLNIFLQSVQKKKEGIASKFFPIASLAKISKKGPRHGSFRILPAAAFRIEWPVTGLLKNFR
jgi:hypothetical protein